MNYEEAKQTALGLLENYPDYYKVNYPHHKGCEIAAAALSRGTSSPTSSNNSCSSPYTPVKCKPKFTKHGGTGG